MIGLLKRTAKCRGCGKDIAFIKTISGKCIPVDPVPVEFMLYEDNERFATADGEMKSGEEIAYHGLSGGNRLLVECEVGYREHRKSCMAAEDMKRKKKNKSERTRDR